ncbi:Hypothetical protein A7982_11402 [Minicystis rosea]|nr:Hypothetical protein A7982_11402 [Minicystis rosea]
MHHTDELLVAQGRLIRPGVWGRLRAHRDNAAADTGSYRIIRNVVPRARTSIGSKPSRIVARGGR